jgi:hypothetical protein
MVFNPAAAVLAQDRTETRREWGLLANGRTEFEVSDPALVPSTLAVAAEQSGCRYKDYIKEYPARFIRPEGRRLATCSAPQSLAHIRSSTLSLRSIVVVESAKNQLLRDFRRRSIFDFCNTIRGRPEVAAVRPVVDRTKQD